MYLFASLKYESLFEWWWRWSPRAHLKFWSEFVMCLRSHASKPKERSKKRKKAACGMTDIQVFAVLSLVSWRNRRFYNNRLLFVGLQNDAFSRFHVWERENFTLLIWCDASDVMIGKSKLIILLRLTRVSDAVVKMEMALMFLIVWVRCRHGNCFQVAKAFSTVILIKSICIKYW